MVWFFRQTNWFCEVSTIAHGERSSPKYSSEWASGGSMPRCGMSPAMNRGRPAVSISFTGESTRPQPEVNAKCRRWKPVTRSQSIRRGIENTVRRFESIV